MKYPIIIITGPTASGKTDVSLLLAKELGAQIVSCDSMLIYREPRIITSKPADAMLEEVKHHFIGVISVKDSYNVFDYYKNATSKINELVNNDIPVVVCGGSGLYLKAILDGIFDGVGRDDDFRKRLEEHSKKEGNESLFEELKKVDLQTAKKISVNDTKRIIRALEVYHSTGIPISQKKSQAQGLWEKLPIKVFGIRFKRDELYQRINDRVEAMLLEGAIGEVKGLLKSDLSITAKKMIGIDEIGRFLKGECTLEQAKEEMKKNTRNFAKRQSTWFRADKRIEWIDADGLEISQIKDIILHRLKI